jgi:2-haloalkanoic acid dehalogenase type II
MKPTLFTFDIFGTVLDWRRGLAESAGADDAAFEKIIDYQGADEQRQFRPYREITARSLVAVLGMATEKADAIGATVGEWPLFADSVEGMRALMRIAPCVATTNSDRAHGEQVQKTLGYRLSDWVCAEELGLYKPAPEFWRKTAERLGRPLNRSWYHVSAYGDYDLEVARALGLTCVFIPRPHHRPGPADFTAPDLLALARKLG